MVGGGPRAWQPKRDEGQRAPEASHGDASVQPSVTAEVDEPNGGGGTEDNPRGQPQNRPPRRLPIPGREQSTKDGAQRGPSILGMRPSGAIAATAVAGARLAATGTVATGRKGAGTAETHGQLTAF